MFCYTSQLKTRKTCEEIVCFTPAGSQIREFKRVLIHHMWHVLLHRKTYLSWKVKQHGIMMQEFLMTSMGWLWIFPGLLSCMCIISRFGRQPCLLDDISESLLSWQTCNHQGLLILSRSVHCFSTLFRLRRLKRVFHFCSVYQTMEDYKEGHLMVWTNYMSPCSSIVELYFKGTCDVISVTMAMHKVHRSVL